MTHNITIIGAGSWGTTLAVLLADNHHQVRLWSYRKEAADQLTKDRENKQFLPGVALANNITITSDTPSSVKGSEVIVFAVPSEFMRSVAKQFKSYITENQKILHVAKGIEAATGKLMTQVISEELEREDISVLSGPNIAKEVAQKKPTATVIASSDPEEAAVLCKLFTTPYFKAYPHDDVDGVQVCGIIKNIIALAIGVCDGLGLGDNAKASILTLGLAEMNTVGRAFGAKRVTCFGLAGVGDLITSCYSKHGRNRRAGELIAQGKSKDEIQKAMNGMIAEGIKNTKTVYELCQKNNLQPTIITQAHRVLYEDMDIGKAVTQLIATV